MAAKLNFAAQGEKLTDKCLIRNNRKTEKIIFTYNQILKMSKRVVLLIDKLHCTSLFIKISICHCYCS